MKVFVSFLLIFSSLFSLLSCSGKLGEDGPIDANTVRLTVEVGGIEDLAIDVPAAKMQRLATTSQPSFEKREAPIRSLSSGILVQAVSDEKNLAAGAVTSRNQKVDRVVSMQSNRGNTARQVMAEGMKYRILLYEKASGTFYRSYVATAGTKLEIDVVKSQEYNWIAYSYNNTKDVPLPASTASPTINTPTDTELLYASGSVTAAQQQVPLLITFAHKLAKISLSLNTEGMYADIVHVRAALETADYVRSGTFDLRTGLTGNLVSLSTSEIDFQDADPSSKNLKVATFYTADPDKLRAITIQISSLSVKYPNGTTEDVVTDAAPMRSSFGPYNPAIGKEAIANLNLWKVLKTKKMVHVGRVAGFGYSASDMASYNMLANSRNFGNLSSSLVKMQPFTHVTVNADGRLLSQLNAAVKPDIILMAVYYNMSRAEIEALADYTRAGGVVLLFTDNAGGIPEQNAHLDYLKNVFNTTSIQRGSVGGGGYVFPLANHDDIILNGPFGDIRSRAWGEDASLTTILEGLPASDVTIYSGASAVNSTTARTGATMFKHNSLNLFWIGDGGFLSNTSARGNVPSLIAFPFATDQNDFPVKKSSYGVGGNGHAAGSLSVYNSVVFANAMAWAVMRAEFFGIN
ncbi:fimbrillin family protein [Sphingobacterium deserti]|uniref:Uncharacterized protein n=1 Tax=Sphingobacterium deserti TaxID=1229276 RepID=A0A0B8TAD0_9SPHI|nr:fimbrillin family protein [Sphingobacterium deserti]KGE15040.1 hypothetical protein DI53_1267 [Sphingobacterium deserti]